MIDIQYYKLLFSPFLEISCEIVLYILYAPFALTGDENMEASVIYLSLYLIGNLLYSFSLYLVLQHKKEIEDLNPWFFPLPSNPCSVVPGSNHEFMNSVYRVVLSSPVVCQLYQNLSGIKL